MVGLAICIILLFAFSIFLLYFVSETVRFEDAMEDGNGLSIIVLLILMVITVFCGYDCYQMDKKLKSIEEILSIERENNKLVIQKPDDEEWQIKLERLYYEYYYEEEDDD